MYSFKNDYSEGAHPRILEALINANLTQNDGYGLDGHSENARELIRKAVGQADADVHFISGGTQTNLLAIASALRPYQAAVCAHTGHINVHETGAIEGTGHKVLAIRSADGKLTPAMVDGCVREHTDEHMVQPKLVYISDSTEVGTVYTKEELAALYHYCRQHDLFLFLDGARLGAALTAKGNDLTLPDIAALTDMFYIGGTKNGALFGEALVILNPELKKDFRYMTKNRGAMLAKGFVAGIQFEELFSDDLYFELATHANEMAGILKEGIRALGYPFHSDSPTNQQFVILPDDLVAKLEEQYRFETSGKPDGSHTVIRLVTSWATPEKAVREFLDTLKKLTDPARM